MTPECRYNPDGPRLLDDGDPCPEPHCRVPTCPGRHAEHVCAECVGELAENLDAIAAMCTPRVLVTEAAHRGTNSSAAVLAGPVADAEQWSHVEASVLAGRLPYGWQETATDDRHPLAVLGWWDMIVRDHLEQVTDEPITIATSAAYLVEHRTTLARDPWFDFPLMAAQVRKSRFYTEDVIRAGERSDKTQVPCLDCGKRLVVAYATRVADDRHKCPRCHRTYGATEFALAQRDWLDSEGADRWVYVVDAAACVGRPEKTVRTWVERAEVASERDPITGRLMVWWPDVRYCHSEKAMRVLRQKAGLGVS